MCVFSHPLSLTLSRAYYILFGHKLEDDGSADDDKSLEGEEEEEEGWSQIIGVWSRVCD